MEIILMKGHMENSMGVFYSAFCEQGLRLSIKLSGVTKETPLGRGGPLVPL